MISSAGFGVILIVFELGFESTRAADWLKGKNPTLKTNSQSLILVIPSSLNFKKWLQKTPTASLNPRICIRNVMC
jgi:hypothetical protein